MYSFFYIPQRIKLRMLKRELKVFQILSSRFFLIEIICDIEAKAISYCNLHFISTTGHCHDIL